LKIKIFFVGMLKKIIMAKKLLFHERMRVRPLFRVDHSRPHTAFLFEALLSAMVITLTIMVDDYLSEHIEKQKLVFWQKYLLHVLIIFSCTLFCIYTLLYIFGYGEAVVPGRQ